MISASQSSFTAVVDAINDRTPTVREFTLRPLDGRVLHWAPGAHLQVQVLVQGAPVTRSYSVIGLFDTGACRIAVKRLDDGKGGSLAMWRLAVGDQLQVSGPDNHFPLALDAPAYLLVAGGIGVTPLVGMAQLLSGRGATVRMAYGARSLDELAYAAELRECLGERLCPATQDAGQMIALDTEIAALPPGGQMYVCGPAPMLDAARRAWTAAGRPAADFRYETFGSSGSFAQQAFRLRVPRHALDIMVPADCSLLDALESAGVQTLADCRRGECGLCAIDVLEVEGDIDHRDVFFSAHEKAAKNRICACVSRAVGSITVDSAWRPD